MDAPDAGTTDVAAEVGTTAVDSPDARTILVDSTESANV